MSKGKSKYIIIIPLPYSFIVMLVQATYEFIINDFVKFKLNYGNIQDVEILA